MQIGTQHDPPNSARPNGTQHTVVGNPTGSRLGWPSYGVGVLSTDVDDFFKYARDLIALNGDEDITKFFLLSSKYYFSRSYYIYTI